MTENPSHPEPVELPVLIDQLSEKLSFGDREKLAGFVRGMVAVVLEAVAIRAHKKINAEKVRFLLGNMNRELGATMKLDFVESGSEAKTPTEICCVSIKVGEYRGLPDGVKMGKDPTQAAQMVGRRRISVVDFKLTTINTWISLARVLKTNKSGRSHLLHLDAQTKP